MRFVNYSVNYSVNYLVECGLTFFSNIQLNYLLLWDDKETERRLYQTIEIYDWSNDITDKFSLKWWRFTYQYSICYYVTDHFH